MAGGTLQFRDVRFVAPYMGGKVVVGVFVARSNLRLGTRPIRVQVDRFYGVIYVNNIGPFVSLLVGIRVVVTRLVQRVRVTRQEAFCQMVRRDEECLAPRAPNGDGAKVVPFPLVVNNVRRRSSSFLQVRACAWVREAFQFELRNRSRVLLTLTNRFMICVDVNVYPSRGERKFTRFLRHGVAILL